MKKLLTLLIVFILCSAISVSAGAFDKGSKSISGGISYTHLSGDAYYDTDILELSPKVSLAISHGFFVGGIIQVRSISADYSYGSYSDTQWQLGVITERYFVHEDETEKSTIPFLKFSLMFSNDNSITQLSFGGNFGILKMVSESVGFDFGIKGSYDRFSANSNSISGITLQAAIGVSSFIF